MKTTIQEVIDLYLAKIENFDYDGLYNRGNVVLETDKKDFSSINFSYFTIDNDNPGLDEKALWTIFDNLIN